MIAANHEVLQRYLWAAHSEIFEPWFSQLAVSVFVCLAQSPDAHKFLTTEDVLDRVIETCHIRRELPGSAASDILLLE